MGGPRPLQLVQGTRGPGALQCDGGARLRRCAQGQTEYAAAIRQRVPGSSGYALHPQPGSLHGLAWAGAVARSGNGAGVAAGRAALAILRHAGRWRDPGRPDLGGRHGGGVPQGGQPGGHRGLQPDPTRWLRQRHHGDRAGGGQMAVVRLAHAGDRRPRFRGDRGRAGRGRGDQGQAHLHRGAHRQGEGRIVHGEQPEVPRRGADARRIEAGPTGAQLTMPAKTKFEIKMGPATREAFGRTLVELGRENKDVVVVDADLSKSTMTTYFAKEFPDRFISCGIAEANMVGVGAGLAMVGKIPFIASFSVFVMNKGFEQMRIGAAYGRSNLKVVGTHSGITIGEDGPSQMSIEEISLACSLAGFVVLAPADENATKALVRAAAAYDGPVFIRCGRPKAPVVYGTDQKFEIGKSIEVAADKH